MEDGPMNRYEYHRPGTVQEALDLAERVPEARFVAGGTDLLVRMRKHLAPEPPALISLRRIEKLRAIERRDGAFRIGAGATVGELLRDEALRKTFPALAQGAEVLGSVQLRNTATIGGNLCNASPAANLAPPLLVHEAVLELRSSAGTRQVPIDAFFTGPCASCVGPAELLTAVTVRPPGANSREIFLRKSRVRMDLAQVAVSARLEFDGKTCVKARVAAGAVSPTPVRLAEVEGLLEGAAIDETVLEAVRERAAGCVRPITDLRAGAAYRCRMTGVLVKRAVESLIVRIR